METLIETCLYAMRLTYWVFGIGSIFVFNVLCWKGILIGIIAWVLNAAILQVLFWIKGDGWLWNP